MHGKSVCYSAWQVCILMILKKLLCMASLFLWYPGSFSVWQVYVLNTQQTTLHGKSMFLWYPGSYSAWQVYSYDTQEATLYHVWQVCILMIPRKVLWMASLYSYDTQEPTLYGKSVCFYDLQEDTLHGKSVLMICRRYSGWQVYVVMICRKLLCMASLCSYDLQEATQHGKCTCIFLWSAWSYCMASLYIPLMIISELLCIVLCFLWTKHGTVLSTYIMVILWLPHL